MTRRGGGRCATPMEAIVGDLYLVSTSIYTLGVDAHDHRPVVVVAVGAGATGRIQFVTRTASGTRGVPHDRSPECGLYQPGRFSVLAGTEKQLWTSEYVRRLGTLDMDTWAQVQKRYT